MTHNSSKSTRSRVASSTGNFETLGSKFSNETALLAACVLDTIMSHMFFTVFLVNVIHLKLLR